MKALLVDDSRTMRSMLRRIMQDAGFEVSEAGDGQQALDSLTGDGLPDVALVDWNMPVMDGLQFVSAVRGNPDFRRITLVMVTTESEQSQIVRALAAGAHEYLIKPFTAGELARRLRAYARYRERLAAGAELTQADVDRAVRTLHDVPGAMPRAVKGQSPVTSRLVAEALRRAGEPRSAVEISDEVGISRATAQRYLASLAQSGRVLVTLRYGSTGRPEHEYAWREEVPGYLAI